MTKRPRGLDLRNLGEGLGEGLLRISYGAEWLAGGKLAVPQACPICPPDAGGSFASLDTLRHHLEARHPGLSPRQRSQAFDSVRISARRAFADLRARP